MSNSIPVSDFIKKANHIKEEMDQARFEASGDASEMGDFMERFKRKKMASAGVQFVFVANHKQLQNVLNDK